MVELIYLISVLWTPLEFDSVNSIGKSYKAKHNTQAAASINKEIN